MASEKATINADIGENLPRDLTEEDKLKLEKQDTKIVGEFKRNKLEQEAGKNWDLFYKRNETRFFKDRHWTTREFTELCNTESCEGQNVKRVLLEVGCGVGNFLFPLQQKDPNLYVHCCDISHRAINLVKANTVFNSERCNPFQCDITKDQLKDNVAPSSVDIVSLIFLLSALHPDKMSYAVKNIVECLRPGGLVLFRDYAIYDQAMLRFAPGSKLSENFYVRQDGTRAYYFTTDKVAEIFTGAGLVAVENEYINRRTTNVKEGVDVGRIFVQGRFRKPLQ